jgi:DNA-binding NarL/FixJ family response regulator
VLSPGLVWTEIEDAALGEGRPVAAEAPVSGLTPREQEVLGLLAAGKTDREIAEALFVSVRTVEGHVARIFGKLGVRTRTAAATVAIAAGHVVPDTSDSAPSQRG